MKRRPKTQKAHRAARIKRAKPNTAGGRLRTERTTTGEQYVIAGTERIPPAEVARRHASEPLKPTAKRKPADHGLFSDENQQIDFFDQPVISAQLETMVGVSFMITQHQKEELRGLGYTDEQIWEMKPEDAHAILKDRNKA